jgi:hypothetical protein
MLNLIIIMLCQIPDDTMLLDLLWGFKSACEKAQRVA